MDLYQELMGQSQPQPQQTNQNDFMSNLQLFAQNFRGDPTQQVMQLMQQKGISQNAFNDAVQKTNQIYKMLNGGKR